jgi:hypothetical protein
MYFQVVPLEGLFDLIPSPANDTLLKGDGRFKDYYNIDDDDNNTDDGGLVDLNHWN